MIPFVNYSFVFPAEHKVPSPLVQIQEPACLTCSTETGVASPSNPATPGQAEVTPELLSSPCRSLCPALRRFVSFCPFPNLVFQSFWSVYAFPNVFQQILFPLYWMICFCCLRVLTDTLPISCFSNCKSGHFTGS